MKKTHGRYTKVAEKSIRLINDRCSISKRSRSLLLQLASCIFSSLSGKRAISSRLLFVFCSSIILGHTNQALAKVYAPQLLKDIVAGSDGSSPQKLAEYNGALYFTAENALFEQELWKSDGTSAGTELVKSVYIESNLNSINGTLYFRSWNNTDGSELWRSNGTATSTYMIKDINPGSSGSGPNYFTNANGTVYFSASDDNNGQELWRTDGTAAGTSMVKDIRPGSYGSSPSNLTDVNGILYFQARDSLSVNGAELWKSDGTAVGTQLVKDIRPGASGSFPKYLINYGGVLYFYASDGASNYGLWKSDGTAPGTIIVKSSIVLSSPPVIYNGWMYFSASDGAHGRELWKSDGTTAGTVMVKDIVLGTNGSSPGRMASVNGVLYFATAANGYSNEQLWKTDGTAPGTLFVKETNTIGSSSIGGFIEFDSLMYFLGKDSTNKYMIWKSDGSTSGTTIVADPTPGSTFNYPSSLVKVGSSLLHSAYDDVNGQELWHLVERFTAGASVDSNGTVDMESVTVFTGVTASFVVTPDSGFETDSAVGGDCPAGAWSGASYTTGNLVSDCSVSFTHTALPLTVTPGAGANGSITPSVPQTVNHNTTTQFTIVPDPNYSSVVTGTCGGVLNGNTYTTNSIVQNCTVEASFILNNLPPVITEGENVTILMDEDASPTAFNLTLNATDINLDTLTWSIAVNGTKGVATASGTGASKVISYTPGLNQNGSDSFDINVSDGALQDSITVNVTINPVDDPPFVSSLINDVNVSEDSADSVIDLSGHFDDIDSLSIILSIQSNSNTALLGASLTESDLTLSYLPDQNGSTDIMIRATADGKTVDDVFTVTVNPVNDAPVFSSAEIFPLKDGVTEVGQITASDIEDDGVSFTLIGGNDMALFLLTPAGTLSFLSAPDIQNPVDFDLDNTYELIIQAFDGTDTTDQTVAVKPYADCTYYVIPTQNNGHTAMICL